MRDERRRWRSAKWQWGGRHRRPIRRLRGLEGHFGEGLMVSGVDAGVVGDAG